MQRVTIANSRMRLPTAAKITGALGLALTAAALAQMLPAHLPVGTRLTGLTGVAVAVAVVIGWRVIGMVRMTGLFDALTVGCRSGVYLAFWMLAYLGLVQMLQQAMRMRYHGTLDALQDVAVQGAALGQAAFQPDIIVTLIVGAVLSAMFGMWIGRRWS